MKTLEQCVASNIRNMERKKNYWITVERHPKAPYTTGEVYDAICVVFDLAGTVYLRGRYHMLLVRKEG